MASDVQPLLYIEDLERGIGFSRDSLGFEVSVFGHHPDTGAPLIAGADLEGATLLLSNEELFRDGEGGNRGNVLLYLHVKLPVDDLYARIAGQPDVIIMQEPTDQRWGDRTLIVRDPWGVLLVFSNSAVT